MAYHEHLHLHVAFASHIGSAHAHKCGIPQGCPFSMMFIAFILRPWHLAMQSFHAVPRALADDLLITTKGDQALLRFQLAFDYTCDFLHDLGAKVSGHKSGLFSSHPPS
eukprot:40436-Karenia_brevis.AAC.1